MKKPLLFSEFRIEYAQKIWDKCNSINNKPVDYIAIECYANYIHICGLKDLSEKIYKLKNKTIRGIEKEPTSFELQGYSIFKYPTIVYNPDFDVNFSENVNKEIDKLMIKKLKL